MDFFSDSLGRLKHELRVSKDGEVAAVLGLSKTAFSERKKRNSFPEKELKELAQKRPELAIDVLYVLTGEREYSAQETQDQFIDRMQAINATGRIVDALPLPDREREGLKLCLTGDAEKDGVSIAEALKGGTSAKIYQLESPNAPAVPERDVCSMILDLLHARGRTLPSVKVWAIVDAIMALQRAGISVDKSTVDNQLRLVK